MMSRAATAAQPRRRLRVVTLLDVLTELGGAEQIALNIAVGLDPDRFESIVCASRFAPDGEAPDQRVVAERVRRAGVRLLCLGRSSTLDVAAWRPLVSVLRQGRTDVLHAHMLGSNVWGTILGRLAGVPVVVAHEHGWGAEQPPQLRRLLDREVVGRGASAFVAVSRTTRQQMIDVAGVRARDIVVIPNGIAPPVPAPSLRDELAIPESAPVIGTVAVLRPEKALDVLLRAAARVRARFPDLRVLIVGDGAERTRLEALVEELGVDDAVLLPGFRRDIPRVLATLDAAVFSSTSEGSPLAIMEAMASGRPIVATRVGGVPDLVDDGVEGLLVQPGDAGALADAVVRVLERREEAADMGRRAQARCRRECTVDVMVRRVEALYEELHAQARGKRAAGKAMPC